MTIHFPDVSHYNAGLDLRGAPAAIAKASQGTSFVDVEYAGFRNQARALEIPFAAYHWVDGSSVAAQAQHAHAVAGDTPMMWDCEADGSTVDRILALTCAYRQCGGTVHLCYLPAWWWQRLGQPDLRPLARAGLSIVSSNYPRGGYTENGPGWAPYGGVTPAQWQYTSSRSFNGKFVDFNAFKGTAEQWWDMVTGEQDMPTVAEILAADIDPGAGSYTLGGALYVILGRSAVLNQWPSLVASVAALTKLVTDSAGTGGMDPVAFTAAIDHGVATAIAPLQTELDALRLEAAQLRARLAAAFDTPEG